MARHRLDRSGRCKSRGCTYPSPTHSDAENCGGSEHYFVPWPRYSHQGWTWEPYEWRSIIDAARLTVDDRGWVSMPREQLAELLCQMWITGKED